MRAEIKVNEDKPNKNRVHNESATACFSTVFCKGGLDCILDENNMFIVERCRWRFCQNNNRFDYID